MHIEANWMQQQISVKNQEEKKNLYQNKNNVLFLLTDPKLTIKDNTSLNLFNFLTIASGPDIFGRPGNCRHDY